MYQADVNQNKPDVTILIPDRIEFKAKKDH